MKIKFYAVFFMLFIFGSALTAGCSAKSGNYGSAISDTATIPIGNILSAPQKFEGKTVKIEGKITEECPTGGWFMLKDKTAVVFVNLHSSNFAIPQAVGQTVATEGIVKKNGPQIQIEAKGVQIK